jgi:hypothetical protein
MKSQYLTTFVDRELITFELKDNLNLLQKKKKKLFILYLSLRNCMKNRS